MNDRTFAVKPFWDVLDQAGDSISSAKNHIVTALCLLKGARWCIRKLFLRRRPRKHAVRAHITFGAPTATALVEPSLREFTGPIN